MMNLVPLTKEFVKQQLQNAESGHDWFHIERVWKLSKTIAESYDCNRQVVELGALLHDIADAKFHNGDETLGPKIAEDFLTENHADPQIISRVLDIMVNISFKNRNEVKGEKSIELQIVQDADRLDAIGAIGIARTFNFGGFKNNPIYIPEIKPNIHQSKEEYKKNKGTTINHFYEKLLLLKDLMNTEKGKSMAEERHRFMETFLERFFSEWEGER